MATKTQIANLAMLRIGENTPFTDVDTDATPAAVAIRNSWDLERDTVLRAVPWAWATKYAKLEDGVEDPNPDWAFAYAYPDDCVSVRRIADAGRLDPNPPAFRIGLLEPDESESDESLEDVACLFTDFTEPTIEYTKRVEAVAVYDSAFVSMFAWRLCAVVAAGVSRLPDIVKLAAENYEKERAEAIGTLQREGQKDYPVDSLSDIERKVMGTALQRIGVTKDTDQKSGVDLAAQARLMRITFEGERDYVIRDFDWPFLTRYAALEHVDGSQSSPANGDWVYAYKYPDDALFVRRIVTPKGRRETHPPAFRTASGPLIFESGESGDDSAQLVFSNYRSANTEPPTLNVEYSRRMAYEDESGEEPAEFDLYDPIFSSMLAWRIAAMIAPSRVDAKVVDKRVTLALQMYELEKAHAQARARRESQDEPTPEAEWIRARTGECAPSDGQHFDDWNHS
jgi:hypothetical protein